MPLLRLMRCRATGLLMGAKTAVYHINQTLPQAGTRRGVAFEPLCVPSAQERSPLTRSEKSEEFCKLFPDLPTNWSQGSIFVHCV